MVRVVVVGQEGWRVCPQEAVIDYVLGRNELVIASVECTTKEEAERVVEVYKAERVAGRLNSLSSVLYQVSRAGP